MLYIIIADYITISSLMMSSLMCVPGKLAYLYVALRHITYMPPYCPKCFVAAACLVRVRSCNFVMIILNLAVFYIFS